MINSCAANACQRSQDSNITIPPELMEDWKAFVAENCPSINCPRRYTKKCCIWGKFEKKDLS